MGIPTSGTTGLGSPQDDLKNHTRILRQLKETTEVAQRQRGNSNNSFINLGELLATGVFRYVSNQLSYVPQRTAVPLYAPCETDDLPTPTLGARGFVTDATATTFASALTGGGSNKVPVYATNSGWFIG